MTTPKRPTKAWLKGLRDAIGRERRPASRSYRYMAHLVARSFPTGERGVALAFCCPDGDALAGDVILMEASCLRSELGSSVLMIDARAKPGRGGLSMRLGLDDGRPGFSDWLGGDAVDVDELVTETGIAEVAVLPQGRHDRPVVVQRARLEQLLDQARARYHYVLVQLGSVIDDTRHLVIATHVDAVMLLAHEDRTLMSNLAASRDLLWTNGVDDVRVVLAASSA